MQPLVIGTSPPMPIATKSEAPAAPADDTAIATNSALAIPTRDPRAKVPARGRALLVTELQGLETLFASTAKAAPARLQIVRRLADTYAELSRSTDSNAQVVSVAHKKALQHYELITSEYAQYPQIDEAYYYAALEYELAGDARNARRSYYELIKRAPSSKLTPYAYFAFGELFFAESATDPSKLDLAEQAYAEVLKYPPPTNAIHGEAKKRMAEVRSRRSAARP